MTSENEHDCRYKQIGIKQEYEFHNALAKILGYPYDDEYGWVTGDHVASSLLLELERRFTPPAPPAGALEALLDDAVAALANATFAGSENIEIAGEIAARLEEYRAALTPAPAEATCDDR